MCIYITNSFRSQFLIKVGHDVGNKLQPQECTGLNDHEMTITSDSRSCPTRKSRGPNTDTYTESFLGLHLICRTALVTKGTVPQDWFYLNFFFIKERCLVPKMSQPRFLNWNLSKYGVKFAEMFEFQAHPAHWPSCGELSFLFKLKQI
jgi:hypothetical protein